LLLQDAIHSLQARQARLGRLFETHRHSEEDRPHQVADRSRDALPEHRYGVGHLLVTQHKRRSASSAVAGLLLGSLFLSVYGGLRLANPLGSLSFLYCIVAGMFWLNLIGRFLFSPHRGRHKGVASLFLYVLPFVVLFFFTKSVRESFIAPELPSSGPTAVCLDNTYSYSRVSVRSSPLDAIERVFT
jgi:hypothetical protein